MRIVGGRFRGRALLAPGGRSTRPTSDRARESIFNVLAHAAWAPALEEARVIDVFAGSGAMGLEAMSRGAAFCLFVETDARARGAIRANAEALGVLGAVRVHRRDATGLGDKPAGLGAPFDLAFLDPPYERGLAGPAADRLAQGGWLAPTAALVVEMGSEETPPPIEGFTVQSDRRSGAARIVMLARDEAGR